MKLFVLAIICSALCWGFIAEGFAEEEEMEEELEEGQMDGEGAEGSEFSQSSYVPLRPTFVTNFTASQLRYVKADLTLRVRGNETVQSVQMHLPWIRNNIILLLNSQDEYGVTTMEGKQLLKDAALQEVIAVLENESEPAEVLEVLFTGFLVE